MRIEYEQSSHKRRAKNTVNNVCGLITPMIFTIFWLKNVQGYGTKEIGVNGVI